MRSIRPCVALSHTSKIAMGAYDEDCHVFLHTP